MKYRMLNPFITKDGVLHAKDEIVDLDDFEVKVGMSFGAIEVAPDEEKEVPTLNQPVDQTKIEAKTETKVESKQESLTLPVKQASSQPDLVSKAELIGSVTNADDAK